MLKSRLRFDGSVLCNLEVAMRIVTQVAERELSSLNITPIEMYVLLSLYENNRQHASSLAAAVGRPATSFTPTLDKLEKKGFIRREPDVE